jgi:hypothetical protein
VSPLPRPRAALLAATAGLLTLVSATTASADVTAQGDLDGDGTPDTVTLTPQSEGVEQKVTVTAGGQTAELTLSLSTPDGLPREPRFVDLNDDGKDEVLVTETVGDSNTTFVTVDLGAGGLRVMKTPEGQELRFFEGDTAVARSGYTCKQTLFGREFTILFAVAADESADPSFIGTLAGYRVSGGVATPTTQIPIFWVKGDNPQLTVDPSACAA